MSKQLIFKGCATAVITPFNKYGEIDFHEMERIIEFQVLSGVDALVICGTTGEAPTLTDTEHQAIIECCAGIVNKRVPVICSTGSNDTAHATTMSKCAIKNGADALMLVTPYYNKTTQKGLIKSYLKIADSIDAPIMLYNVPGRTGIDISFDTYKKLSEHPNITAVKEASGNLTKFGQLVRELGDSMKIYTGNDDNLISTLALGGSGIVSVTSNILPGFISGICCDWFNKNYERAITNYEKLYRLNELLFSEVNPIPIKSAMKILGFGCGNLRLPLIEMTQAGKRKLRKEMQRLDII